MFCQPQATHCKVPSRFCGSDFLDRVPSFPFGRNRRSGTWDTAGPSTLSQVLVSMLVSCCRHVSGSEPLRACELDQVSPFDDNPETPASDNWQSLIYLF